MCDLNLKHDGMCEEFLPDGLFENRFVTRGHLQEILFGGEKVCYIRDSGVLGIMPISSVSNILTQKLQ